MSYAVGIDLGTTNTVCCTYDNSFSFIKCRRSHILPSVLMYKDGKITVGEIAKQHALRAPNNVISSAKTFMADPEKKWIIEGRTFTPTDVATEVLREINEAAQKHFGTDEQIEAVITIPAYFTASQANETKKAAEAAGLKVLKIIAEPVAAAIAYGLDDTAKNIFVVDLGGGTFDVCILTSSQDKDGTRIYTTGSVDGDIHLGGDDFDAVIENLCYSQLRKEYGINLASQEQSGLEAELYGQAIQKIRQKAEQAKIALSDSTETSIDIANLCSRNGNIVNFRYTITRQDFEKAADSLFKKIKRILTRCLEDSNTRVDSIDKVIYVGGSSNIPYLRSIVTECLDREPYADQDLSKLVAMGAAVYAADKSNLVSTKLHIEDILSHSLGIEVYGEKLSIILPKGTKYPISKTEEYSTVTDYQKSVSVKVYEGECTSNINENLFYDEFTLTNIRNGLRGIPVNVKFEINDDRQLIVTAWDPYTGSTKSKRIEKDF